MLARWAALAAAVLATGLLLFSLAGGFSYDRGMYLDVEGARLSGGKPYGHVYVVKMDRGLGPDRKLLITTELGVAWQFMQAYGKTASNAKYAGGN